MTSTRCNCCIGGFDQYGYVCQYCHGTGWRIDAPVNNEKDADEYSE